jgi:zeaxanthin glucosyltransferase
MTTIGRELRRRGHRFTVLNIPDVESLAESEGAEFCPLGAGDHPPGSFRGFSEKLSNLHGLQALRFGLATAAGEIEMILRDAPEAIRSRRIDALLVDQGQPAGSTLAQFLGIPFVTICNAIAEVPDPSVPPGATPWQYSDHWLARLRNRAVHMGFDIALKPILRTINRSRKHWGFKPLASLNESRSPWAVVSQQTADFDFPHKSLPKHFHYVGLLRRTASARIPFPFDRLDGRPLVYATLGTVHSDTSGVLHNLSNACKELDAQLAITLGGRGDLSDYSGLPGQPIVVQNAPQLAVLERAAVTFCHGGTNTVLESLSAGVPVAAMPLAFDQYGCAARLARCGAGDIVPARHSRDQLHHLLRRLLNEPRYRERAQVMRESIEKAGGERRAADIIEDALTGRAPGLP